MTTEYLDADGQVEHARLTGAPPIPSRIRPVDPSRWVFPGTTREFPIETVRWTQCFLCTHVGVPDARLASIEFESHLMVEHACSPGEYIARYSEDYPLVHQHFPVWHVGVGNV